MPNAHHGIYLNFSAQLIRKNKREDKKVKRRILCIEYVDCDCDHRPLPCFQVISFSLVLKGGFSFPVYSHAEQHVCFNILVCIFLSCNNNNRCILTL